MALSPGTRFGSYEILMSSVPAAWASSIGRRIRNSAARSPSRSSPSRRDIMYFFGFGGDIPGFFGRYRDRLRAREDIAIVSGLSSGDLQQLHALYDEE